jgi:hypothetical protein
MNVSLFKPTDETFIISELPEVGRNEYNIPRQDQSLHNDTHIGRLPLLDLSGARMDRYGYLATAQNTKFALVPIHTNEEYKLFNREVLKFAGANGEPDFKAMARWWSTQANGKTIEKLPRLQQPSPFRTDVLPRLSRNSKYQQRLPRPRNPRRS